MIEMLLQADRALADGQFDEAERAYWQLIELDPTNAMALSGLAHIALERDDTRLARRLAETALVVDPDSVTAKEIVETLENKGVRKTSRQLPDLTLLAARRLEELGRHRIAQGSGASGADGWPGERTARMPASTAKGGHAAVADHAAAAGSSAATSHAAVADHAAAAGSSAAAAGTGPAAKTGLAARMARAEPAPGRSPTQKPPSPTDAARGRSALGGNVLDSLGNLPSEPLQERRRAGRAAAEAAAKAAPRKLPVPQRAPAPKGKPQAAPAPARTRRATPLADKRAAAGGDEFAAAESAAAIEAIDAVDDVVYEAKPARPAKGPTSHAVGLTRPGGHHITARMPALPAVSAHGRTPGRAGRVVDEAEVYEVDEEADEARAEAEAVAEAGAEAMAEADPSVALRIAALGQAVTMDEAEAAPGVDESVALRIAAVARAAGMEAAKAGATVPDAAEQSAAERETEAWEAAEEGVLQSTQLAESRFDAALEETEVAARRDAARQVAAEVDAIAQEGAQEWAEPAASAPRPPARPEPSEEDAESQALREAMTFALQNANRDAAAPQDAGPPQAVEPSQATEPPPAAEPSQATEPPPAAEGEPGEPPTPAPQRKGFLGRFRGG